MEKLSILPFSGKLEDWTAFKSLFKTLVIHRPKIRDASKLHYLRTKVREEALELKNVELTHENCTVAWIKLEEYYVNKRRLVNIHLDSLLSLKPIKVEISAEVNRLLDGTVSPLLHLRQ